ncbi:MAG: GNAT family N-acetyltransferase [Myxococcota bacterium]
MWFLPYRVDVHRDDCLAICSSNIPRYIDPTELADFDEFLASYADHGARYVVGIEGDRVLACGGLAFDADRRLTTLCWGLVHHDHHRRELGTALLEERLSWVDPGWTTELRTTQKTRAFFERFGFVAQRIVPDGYGPGLDQIHMVRSSR